MNEVKTKPTKLSIEAAELELSKEQCLLEKIEELRHCLCAIIIEVSDPCQIGEQTYRPVFDESETKTLKNKLFDLLHKL